jgi:2-iminobutanoate/2-iminopropanoate deaminase
MRAAIAASGAPQAIGPYSSALRVGSLLFISGQLPLEPASGHLVDGDVSAQTRRVLENLGALLTAAGLAYAHVVRTTIFLADMEDFGSVNEIYRSYFSEPYPARSTVQVARLPRDARVEIDAIASYDADGPR